MNKIPKISDSEWEVMKIVWDRASVTSKDIVKELKLSMNWKETTIYTLIKRLVDKNIIGIKKDSSPNICYPLVSQKECRMEERMSFIKKVYNGSLNLMLANLIEEQELTDEDIEDLKCILEKRSNKRR
ncbi:BlaI/MecI/CopY family transcriptional regulator [Clostridium uliginosum]|uniref:BlaI family transcriptional regulator, penicillinase repressor n=1 Tax=Clostridium uliginosum TaxID=119641 RepID=A0A1I1QPW7_9CLOT|nr:BlaI/MecI/CopY family transcriptional regulator [Clostridium uliginosum]SFD24166.1 BlaI family transcriptional regulator, penicillinase repressor [Clostridium uliginosum]